MQVMGVREGGNLPRPAPLHPQLHPESLGLKQPETAACIHTAMKAYVLLLVLARAARGPVPC